MAELFHLDPVDHAMGVGVTAALYGDLELRDALAGSAIVDGCEILVEPSAGVFDVCGIDSHIGSQLTTLSPFLAALERVLAMVDTLKQEGIAIRHIDLGGGLVGWPARGGAPGAGSG